MLLRYTKCKRVTGTTQPKNSPHRKAPPNNTYHLSSRVPISLLLRAEGCGGNEYRHYEVDSYRDFCRNPPATFTRKPKQKSKLFRKHQKLSNPKKDSKGLAVVREFPLPTCPMGPLHWRRVEGNPRPSEPSFRHFVSRGNRGDNWFRV